MIPDTPAAVLDAQAALAERLSKPGIYDADFLRWFMHDAHNKNQARATGMFYPITLGKGEVPSAEHGQKFAKILGGLVRAAEPFKVIAEMTDAMRAMMPATVGKIEQIEAAEMPCPVGHVWLDDAWVIRDVTGSMVPIRAVSWQFTHVWAKGTDREKWEPREVPCARVALWSHLDDDIRLGRVTDYQVGDSEYNKMITEVGPLTLMHVSCLPFGIKFLQPEDTRSTDDLLALVHVLWMFLTMEITARHRPQLPRATRRRALRSLVHGEVSVITLRRAKHETDDGERGEHETDWSCRWIVQGHSRHIESYEGVHHRALVTTLDGTCAVCSGRTTFVRPYIKGPDDRPLKVTRHISQLSRLQKREKVGEMSLRTLFLWIMARIAVMFLVAGLGTLLALCKGEVKWSRI